MSYRSVAVLVLICCLFLSCGPSDREIEKAETSALAVLVAFLEDSAVGAEYLGEAAEVLGYVKRSSAVPALLKSLSHADEFVVFKAIGALDRIGDDRATASFSDLFRDTQSQILKVELATLLARRGEAEKRNWLLETLQDGPMGIFRSNAASALSRLNDRQAIPALRIAFKGDSDAIVRSSAALALARLNDTASLEAIADTLVQTPLESTALVMVEALEVFGDSLAVHHLENAVMQSNWRFSLRRRCLLALKKVGAQNIGKYLQDLLEHSKEISDHMLAVDGLGLIGDVSSIPMLRTVYNANQGHPLRLGAAAARVRLGDVGGLASDLDADLTSHLEGFQLQAAEVLGLLGDPGTVIALEKAAKSSANPKLKATAVQALGKITHGDAVRALVEIFDASESMAGKSEVIDALAKMRSGYARDALLDLLNRTEFASIKIGCLRGLSRFSDKELIKVFKRYFNDPSPGVRLQAAAGTFYISRPVSIEETP